MELRGDTVGARGQQRKMEAVLPLPARRSAELGPFRQDHTFATAALDQNASSAHPASTLKVPDQRKPATAYPDGCCRVKAFEAEVSDGLALLHSELSDGLASLQRRLISNFETALADANSRSMHGGLCQTSADFRHAGASTPQDAEGSCVVCDPVQDGIDSGDGTRTAPLQCQPERFGGAQQCGYQPRTTMPIVPKPHSPRINPPPDLEPWCENNEEDCESYQQSGGGMDGADSCADRTVSADASPRDSTGSPYGYTKAELDLLGAFRMDRRGRWAVLLIGVLDMADGDVLPKNDEVVGEFAIWDAWTARTKVLFPARGREHSLRIWGQHGIFLTDDEPCKKLSRWRQMLSCCTNTTCMALLRECVVHPSSPVRFPWVCAGGVWIIMDCILIPLQAVGLVADYDSQIEKLMLAYWALDLLLNFFVAYITPDGSVEERLEVICVHYLKSWFAIDLLAVFGEIGVMLFQASTRDYGQEAWTTIRLSQSVRMIRLVKLLRLRKLKALVQEICTDIRTDWLVLVLKVTEHLGYILMLNHYIACGWYGVSKFGGVAHRWIDAHDVGDRGHLYGYILSLHWSLSQFTPSTNNIAPQSTSERLFAIVVVVFALVSFSSFVSGVTNAVNELRTMNMGMSTEGARIRSFLAKKNVSTELGGRMIIFFMQNYRRTIRSCERDIAFFKHFPQSILIALHKELYMSTLHTIPVFHLWRKMDASLLEKLCHVAFYDGWFLPHQDVFMHGDECRGIYFTGEAVLDYASMDPTGKFDHRETDKNVWIAEVGLWIKWVHQGDLSAKKATSMVVLDGSVARSLIAANGGVMHVCLKKFVAFFVGHLEVHHVRVTDLQLERDFQFACATRAQGIWLKSMKLGLSRTDSDPRREDPNLFHARSAWRLLK